MAENSKIGWCDHTVNLWWGCYEVHNGCDNCYAKQLANRYHGPHVLWQQDGPRMAIKSAFNDIRRYQKMAAAAGVRYYIFMNSMSDIFEKSMPVVDFKHELMLNDKDDYLYTGEIRQKFFDIVDYCPNLIFLLLTKRPSNIRKMIPEKWLKEPRRNVMYGTSIVDQPTADTLIPQLLNVPGWHFFSMEPLVGPVDLTIKNLYRELSPGIWANKSAVEEVDWVIVGGESGSMASRPMNSAWVESLKDQVDGTGTAFFFKQWGNWLPLKRGEFIDYAADGSNRTFYFDKSISHRFTRSNDQMFYYTDNHNEDALLDGKQLKAFPMDPKFVPEYKYA